MRELREIFPITSEYTFLNCAAVSPLALPVKEAIEKCIRDQCERGTWAYIEEWHECEARVREKLARLVGGSAEEIALLGNTSDGLATVASGLKWNDGDSVVTCNLEFPANVYPWLNLQDRYGVRVQIVRARDGRVLAEDMFAAADESTRVIAVSYVQWTTGLRMDLESIGRFCKERGIYFVVDAIQGLGALPVDVGRFGVDFMSAGSYKYLLGPIGVGCFYCRKDMQGDVWPSRVGHRNVVDDMSLDYKLDLWPSAKRFEAGAMNYLGLHGLDASLDIIEKAGVENIERHVLRLTDLLIEKLQEKRYRVVSSTRPEERSGIVAFAHRYHASEELLHTLTEAKVVVSLREGAIRASVHLYNDEEDIARLLEVLPL
ncbi:MAG TPA: aminotransferase class V-fold PLP-dependent enzyme [Anaerolineae bacterium]|nr:aminotransferase class V-fold PLP-dependent enzyme [Anaerolineae bacterium]